MKPMNLKTLVAAAAVSLVALGPAAGIALGEKPQAGPPSQAQASRYGRGESRGQGNGAQGQSRGRGEHARGNDRGRGGDARGQDRGRSDAPRSQDRGRSGDPRNPAFARNDDRRNPASAPPQRYERRDGSPSRYDHGGGDSRNFQGQRYDHRRDGDRNRDGDRRYDGREYDSRHYVRPVYQPARYRHAQYRPPHKHYTYYDTRYNHRHYYPPRGYYYPYAPPGVVPIYYNRYRYYYGGGIWYAPRGVGWVVAAPPIGIFVSLLPPYYSTVWFGGIPYYYANDVYYVYRERERVYEVVEPPSGAQYTTVSPATEDIYVYPRQGQSQEQTDFDRYECHRWAADETGFDPTQPDGGVGADQARAARSEYQRAMTACLEGRGYSVR